MSHPRFRVSAATFSSPDTRRLAQFYAQLLGWTVVADDGGWLRVRAPAGGMGLSFHHEDRYVPPVWPSSEGEQLMMVHLDIGCDDLEAGIARAVELGASLAITQPQPDVRVMLDPDGHPFCLFSSGPRGEFDIADWHGTDSIEQ
ncbi:MAG TPA: VOC family protein [Actinomycetota bacterium]|nr:VOC family protein [Actinomycetota bacterium]